MRLPEEDYNALIKSVRIVATLFSKTGDSKASIRFWGSIKKPTGEIIPLLSKKVLEDILLNFDSLRDTRLNYHDKDFLKCLYSVIEDIMD